MKSLRWLTPGIWAVSMPLLAWGLREEGRTLVFVPAGEETPI